jgi:membrane protein implicated in regulation of membrane protease activity
VIGPYVAIVRIPDAARLMATVAVVGAAALSVLVAVVWRRALASRFSPDLTR